MPMTLGECTAANTLLRYVCQIDERPEGRRRPTHDEALDAARTLAERSHKALGAGIYAHQIKGIAVRGQLVALRWKHETEEGQHAFGPIGFVTQEQLDSGELTRPFDPHRPPDPWFTEAQASWLSTALGVRLEVS